VTGADTLEFHARTAERYAELLGRSKGALMKAGQLVSFMSFGPAVPPQFRALYQAALSRLQGDVPPMHPNLARAVLERELGQPAGAAFCEFDWLPLAAASIGQVHAARLHDGRKVAVKVQYPGVAEAIRSDLKNTELLATFFSLIGAVAPGGVRMDLRGGADEVSQRITEELDYRLEASNQRQFADIYRGHPFIHIPEVIDELSTRRVLTQELAAGRDWGKALAAEQDLRNQWGEAIYRFCWGTMHRHDDGRVTFLDFGCVKRFTSKQMALMDSCWGAAVNGDARAVWQATVEGGLFSANDDLTPEDVLAYWREGAEYCRGEQPFTITPKYVAACIEREYSPAGPSGKVMRRLAAPGGYAFLLRIDLGLMSVLGELRATTDWGSIDREHRLGAEPVTPMGLLEREFLEAKVA
jgi:predicted unusual protein kinase regulating ubiquinone biosynthesis (AarF/ABC1/UbiB family)